MAQRAETWLFPDKPGPSYLELIDFVPKKDGMTIPKPAISLVPWLGNAGAFEVILELAEHGRAIGHPSDLIANGLGQLVADQQAMLAEKADSESARTKLIAVADRFIRAKISGSSALYLNRRILHHLDLALERPATIAFLAVPRSFEIWTMEFYERIRAKLADTISEHTTRLGL